MPDDSDDKPEVAGKWQHVESAHSSPSQGNSLTGRKVHSAVSIATTVTSTATTVASHAHYLTVAGVAGAAVLGAGTAGVGLAVAGGVMTTVGIGTSAVSAYKTSNHIDALLRIMRQGSQGRRCTCVSPSPSRELALDHQMIWLKVLPYIIEKKRAKLAKKSVGAAGLSLATSAVRLGKAVHKIRLGTKGVNRTFNAHVLARHAVTHDCWLAEDIISELYSLEDYLAIRALNSTKAGELIAAKMKSV